MGRKPCCEKVGLKKGPWSAEEDKMLINFILTHGQCCWRALPKLAGLLRCGKSCRLRWTNYLRPDLKRGLLSESEEQMVIDLHAKLGNRWSKIASHLAGRTDNEIKNHWNTHIKKKLKKMGIDPLTHKPKQDKVSAPYVSTLTAEDDHDPSENPQQFEENINDSFCIDDVPLIIDPEEILVPATSSSSSSSSESSMIFEIPSFDDWPCSEMEGMVWDLPSSVEIDPISQMINHYMGLDCLDQREITWDS